MNYYLIYKIKKDMERMGSFSYNYNLDMDVDDLEDMFSSIWNDPGEVEEKEQKDDPDSFVQNTTRNYDVKKYTLDQHIIPDDLKKKLKELGIKITRTPYGRLRFEADEFTIGIAENIYKLKFKEEVLIP